MPTSLPIKVGQIWTCHSDHANDGYRIVDIYDQGDGDWKVATEHVTTGSKHSCFGSVDQRPDGTFVTKRWGDGWRVYQDVQNTGTVKNQPSTIPPTMMNFFSAVAEGNCPCNILRSACDFHK